METNQVETEVIPVSCDSCGSNVELFDVGHHQEGNTKIWHYCARCKAAHDKEVSTIAGLKELAKTHPAQADTPETAGMLNRGMGVEEVKAELDRNRTPELEAEIVVPEVVQQ